MSKELESLKQHSDLIQEFYQYCKTKLNLQEDCKISFLINEKNAQNPLGNTGHYIPEEKKVCVYISGRHFKDIARSLAHEIVHHLQNCEGRLENINTEDNYFSNDEYMKELEREAYEKGNMIFREWTESVKK